MPPKKRKFESTFPAARIKKIMQLDDDVGRVASSVPVVISRAVEIFLDALLTRADKYAASRNAKTLTVGHLKHCIVNERQWDFLKDLTAKIPDICADADNADDTVPPKRGRKRQASPSRGKGATSSKRKPKVKAVHVTEQEDEDENEESDSCDTSPARLSITGSHVPAVTHSKSTHPSSTFPLISSGHSLLSSCSMEDQSCVGLYQKQLSLVCSPLSIPELMTAGSTGGIHHQENSDDDYD